MEKAGSIALPASKRGGGWRGEPLGLGRPLPPATDVPADVKAVERLTAVQVEDPGSSRIWNELLIGEHPLGATRQAGCQARYLIGSSHGWLGAVGFSAAALKLKARDNWIGWDEEARAGGVHLLVGLNRFLIRPGICCANLASKSLGLCLRRLSGDFEVRYGFRPLLAETFVSPEFEGTCFLASGWIRVGDTAGRGRFSSAGSSVPPKAIWMRPLAKGWRRKLGVRPSPAPEPLSCGGGLNREGWAENEFGNAPVGDGRLSKRLAKSAAIMAEYPGASFANASGGDEAAVNGFYRLIDQPPESEVCPENILSPA